MGKISREGGGGLTIFTYFGWSVYESQPIWGLGLFEFHLHLGEETTILIEEKKAKIRECLYFSSSMV